MKSKFLTSITLALTLALGTAALAPQKAQAYILVDQTIGPGMSGWIGLGVLEGDPESILLAVGCVILLPFCLFDEKSNSTAASVSTADLLANGYTADQVKQIQADQAILLRNLEDAHAKLVIRNTDNKTSIEADIRTMHPAVSQTYLDFATASMNLK